VQVGGSWIARWADPFDRARTREKNLTALGLTNATQRKVWCERKLAELQGLRAQMEASGGAVTDHKVRDLPKLYLDTRTQRDSTRNTQLPELKKWAEWMDGRGIKRTTQITKQTLRTYRDHLMRPADKRKVSTKARILRLVRACMTHAILADYCPKLREADCRVLLDGVRPESAEIVVLRPKPLRRWLKATSEQEADYGPIAMGLLLTGCRFSELHALTWDDVSFDTNDLFVRQSKTTPRVVTMAEVPTLVSLLQVSEARGLALPFWNTKRSRMAAVQAFTLFRDRLRKSDPELPRVQPKHLDLAPEKWTPS